MSMEMNDELLDGTLEDVENNVDSSMDLNSDLTSSVSGVNLEDETIQLENSDVDENVHAVMESLNKTEKPKGENIYVETEGEAS